MLSSYTPVFMFFIVGAGVAAAMIFLSITLGPRRPSRVKDELFECGNRPLGDGKSRFSVKFYLVALLFLLFDIETVFLYPWAVQYRELGWLGLLEMGTFIAVLVFGLIYVWRKGALEWEH